MLAFVVARGMAAAGGCGASQGIIDIIGSVHSISNPLPIFMMIPPAAPFAPRMSSEISYSAERNKNDEESCRSEVPTLAKTQEKPGVTHKIKLVCARSFPRTYRTTSKVLLYLRGPRPKRDLDRAFPSCDTHCFSI